MIEGRKFEFRKATWWCIDLKIKFSYTNVLYTHNQLYEIKYKQTRRNLPDSSNKDGDFEYIYI